jgi:uncharacterized protein YabN with tetrapyrrole methylase and pyrophosphatase domain
MSRGSAPEIYIVGTGTVAVHQLTREVEAAIRHSKEVLFVDNGFGVPEYLATLCPKVTNLHGSSYEEGVGRLSAYDTMAAKVIEAALDHPPVTFALYGHPIVFAYPPFQIVKAAEVLGLRVKVLPGISSLDTLFVDLMLDPACQGLQIYEATDLLLRKRPLQPDVPCLIWQIGTVESRLYSEGVSKPERFARIKAHLLNFYPAEHPAFAVFSSTFPLAPSQSIEFTIGTLETQAEFLHQGLTVYIPPIHLREVADLELLEIIDSSEHLQEIAQQRIERTPLEG